jgi:hypothetical protein
MSLILGMPLISQTEEVALYADRPYKQYEQVFINYGEKGNGDLLLLYGFSLERNPFDSGKCKCYYCNSGCSYCVV